MRRPGRLPAAPALHALLARGARLGLRRPAQAVGHRAAGAAAGLVRMAFDVRLGTFVGAVLGSDGGCGQRRYGPGSPWAPATTSSPRARGSYGGPCAGRPLRAAQRPVEGVVEVVDEQRPDVPADDRRDAEEGARPVDGEHHVVAGLGAQPQPERVARDDLAVEVLRREVAPAERQPARPEEVPHAAEGGVVGDRVVLAPRLADVLPHVQVRRARS